MKGLIVNFYSSTTDENLWLINSYSDTDPGAVYLYNRKTKKLAFEYRPRPDIPVKSLAVMKPIRYKSSDGLEIPAYLVLPKGVPAKNLPLMVFPHGGPWGRDYWGYNSYAQFLGIAAMPYCYLTSELLQAMEKNFWMPVTGNGEKKCRMILHGE